MARDRAFTNRRAVADGRDLLAERRKARTPTFEAAVDKVIALHREAWKDGGKTASLWRSTLRAYAYPQIGRTSVDQITTADVITTLSKLLKEQRVAAVPHGFRSSFRDWASERTNHPRAVIEAALAHVVRNQTEASYARSDLLEKRRPLMDQWATYVEQDI